MESKQQTGYVLNENDIDDILNELEQQEINNNKKSIPVNIDNNADWNEILKQIGTGNINYIKNLITSNDIDINSQNPINGKTLLIYCVIIGNYDLCRAICNFGADVRIKDNDSKDAVDYATKYGQYKITELLYYRQLSGSLGIDLQNIATQIHHKNKQAQE
eukprot:427903_1